MEGGRRGGLEVAAAWGWRCREGGSMAWHGGGGYGSSMMACGDGGGGDSNSDVLVVGARSGGGGTVACGGGDGGWTPSSTLREQPLEREETPFFSQMTARVCGGGGGGGGSLPSYRTRDGPRGERAFLRPTTQKPKILIEIRRSTQREGFTSRTRKRKSPPGSLKGRGK